MNSRRAAGSIIRRLNKVTRKLVRLDQSTIRETLESFKGESSEVLFVHSSLSHCGYIEGGANTVVNALKGWVAENTLLAMPTHSWSYPTGNGTIPIFDSKSTPSLVGAITDFFWKQRSVVRSLHPSHSLACLGRGAAAFIDQHEYRETPCGVGTPYEKIATTKSSVLMFGATLDSYTLFHTAEDAAQVPYLYMRDKIVLKTKMSDGTVLDVPSWRQDMGVARRFERMADWLENEKLLLRRKIGRGELLFIPRADAVHDRMLRELRQDPFLLVAEHARKRIAG